MNRPHALKLARILMTKTTANGCTVAEAAGSAAKLAEFMAVYKISLGEIMGAEDGPTAPPPQRPRPAPAAQRPRPPPPAAEQPSWKDIARFLLFAFLTIRFLVYLFGH